MRPLLRLALASAAACSAILWAAHLACWLTARDGTVYEYGRPGRYVV